VNMHSRDQEALMKVARDGQSLFAEAVPGMTARPFPNPEMAFFRLFTIKFYSCLRNLKFVKCIRACF